MPAPGWSPEPDARRFAPEALAAFDALGPAADRAVAPALAAAVRHRVRSSLGLEPFDALAFDPDPVAEQRADQELAGRFAEQFTIDVASVPAAGHEALGRRFGAQTFALVQVMWVADFGARTEVAFRQLLGPRGRAAAGRSETSRTGRGATLELWPAVDAFLVEVARLDRLDPVTSELVRLRGARAHNCRLCRSRRLRPAVQAGADEALFDQLDHYEASGLPERQKVALRLTDAMVWSPGAWAPDLVGQVREAFDPAEAVELILDVTRNSANKIAVALGADAAQVADGQLEYFDVGPDGQLVYGLSAG